MPMEVEAIDMDVEGPAAPWFEYHVWSGSAIV